MGKQSFKTLLFGFFLTAFLSAGFSVQTSAQSGNQETEPPLNKYYQSGISSAEQGAMPTARAQFKIGCELDKDARSCFSLATMLEAGIGGPKDETSAKQIYESVCGDGMIQACLKLVDKGETNNEIEKFKTEMEKACAQNDLTACNEIGASYGRGVQGFEKNLDQAKKHYTKACDGGLGESCNNLAMMAYSGEAGAKDPVAARQLAQKSCELKSFNGCANYSVFLYSAVGGEVDLEAARSAAKLACDGGSVEGCTNYGQMLIRGQGGPVNDAEARKAFITGCQKGNPLSCNNIAFMMVQGRGGEIDKAQALTFFKLACDGGFEKGCENVAILQTELKTP